MGFEDCDLPNCPVCRAHRDATRIYKTWGAVMDSSELEKEAQAQAIKQPAHYTRSPIEPLQVIEAWGLGFLDGNAIKYLCRFQWKGDPVGDLKKAIRYLELKIEQIERKGL